MGSFRYYHWLESQNMAYGIKKDWKKRSEKTKQYLFGIQDKTWKKLSFSSIIKEILKH